jgi:O-methyltransferase domain
LIGARAYLANAGVAERVEIVAGDFFESVPASGDLYLLRRVLHDWPDDDALAILRTCRKAIGDRAARLLVADTIMPEHPVAGPAEEEAVFTLDLHMLVLFGARERSVSEFSSLFEATGFGIDEILSTAPEQTIVARPI